MGCGETVTLAPLLVGKDVMSLALCIDKGFYPPSPHPLGVSGDPTAI